MNNRKRAERLRRLTYSGNLTRNSVPDLHTDILKIADELDAATMCSFASALNNAAAGSGGQDSTSSDSHESPAAGHCQSAAPKEQR